ncbi:UNVERIFIED_CONTAM: hypothetical protein RMT77_002516 [Armadillidium vulgare]
MAILSCIHKIKKSLKKFVKRAIFKEPSSSSTAAETKEKKREEEFDSEIEENRANEAIEARLLYLIESSPASLDLTLKGSHVIIPEDHLQYATFWIDDDNSWNLCREAFMRRSLPTTSTRTRIFS